MLRDGLLVTIGHCEGSVPGNLLGKRLNLFLLRVESSCVVCSESIRTCSDLFCFSCFVLSSNSICTRVQRNRSKLLEREVEVALCTSVRSFDRGSRPWTLRASFGWCYGGFFSFFPTGHSCSWSECVVGDCTCLHAKLMVLENSLVDKGPLPVDVLFIPGALKILLEHVNSVVQ